MQVWDKMSGEGKTTILQDFFAHRIRKTNRFHDTSVLGKSKTTRAAFLVDEDADDADYTEDGYSASNATSLSFSSFRLMVD